jgi:very-short-patch-repair endonuclease
MCAKGRLPLPTLQRRLGNRRADFYWADCRLVVETDGRADHVGAVAFLEDRVKDRELKLGGDDVVRVTWAEVVNRPGPTVRELRAHRARRFRELRRASAA